MRTMIRRMIQRFMAVGCLTLIMSIQAEAAPAIRGRFTVKQADGSLLTIEQFGDEYHHWTATTDGTIVINNGHGFFIAEIDEEGQLSATNTLAHEAGHRDYEELALIKKQATRRALFHEKGIETAHRALIVRDGKYLQHTGSPRILTILAAYKDLPFTVNNPVQAFNQVLNADEFEDLGNKNTIQTTSVRKYFETCSYGKFSPQFDLVGPITLPENMDYYGGTSSSGSDDRFNDFCQDAINQAKDLVSDLNVYDCNGDGTIDLVCIIFAGFGQNQGGGANTIWAKSGFMNVTVNDQLKASLFCSSSELFHPSYPEYINGSGVFTHEFSHCLGLPDLYNTKANVSVNNQNMESYSVMDYGLYNHNGFSPCLYTAVSAAAYTFASLWMYILGIEIAGIGANNNIAQAILLAGLGIPGIIIVVLSTVTTNFLAANSAGESSKAIYGKINPKVAGVIVSLLSAALAISGIMEHYISFLYLIASVFAPMAAVLLVSFYFAKGRTVTLGAWLWNLFAWLAGFAVYQVAVHQDSVFLGPTLLAVIVSAALASARVIVLSHRTP